MIAMIKEVGWGEKSPGELPELPGPSSAPPAPQSPLALTRPSPKITWHVFFVDIFGEWNHGWCQDIVKVGGSHGPFHPVFRGWTPQFDWVNILQKSKASLGWKHQESLESGGCCWVVLPPSSVAAGEVLDVFLWEWVCFVCSFVCSFFFTWHLEWCVNIFSFHLDVWKIRLYTRSFLHLSGGVQQSSKHHSYSFDVKCLCRVGCQLPRIQTTCETWNGAGLKMVMKKHGIIIGHHRNYNIPPTKKMNECPPKKRTISKGKDRLEATTSIFRR